MIKRIKCEECKGRITEKEVPYEIYSVRVGNFKAEVCEKCGEVCFSEEESRKITEKTKKMGLWGLEAKTRIGQVGDALDVRFSKTLERFLGLKKGREVYLRPQGKDKVILELAS